MAETGSKWALLIGIDQYIDSIGKLKFAGEDCRALRETLIAGPVGFPEHQVKILADGGESEDQPTYANIHGVLAAWLAAPREEDLVLVYFAGHGRLVDGKSYLLPRDVAIPTIHTCGIPLQHVHEKLEQCKARRKVLIVDACHSGAGRDVGVMHADMAVALQSASGFATITSCGAEEQSHEWEEKGHGVFSYFLNQAMRGGCPPAGDGKLSLDRIYEWVEDRVAQWAAMRRCSQRPMRFSKGSGSIVIADGVSAGESADAWLQVSHTEGSLHSGGVLAKELAPVPKTSEHQRWPVFINGGVLGISIVLVLGFAAVKLKILWPLVPMLAILSTLAAFYIWMRGAVRKSRASSATTAGDPTGTPRR